MHIPLAASTDLFVGSEERPLQVVRATVVNDADNFVDAAAVTVRGERLSTPDPTPLPPLPQGGQTTVEVAVAVDGTFPAGTVLPAEVIVRRGQMLALSPLEFSVAEPGWRMFMVSHFHYDPVWWNTQAAYTGEWEHVGQHPWEYSFQASGLSLVAAHLDMARRDPVYRFALAELDSLTPYGGAGPEVRAWIRQPLSEGRLKLMGGTSCAANTNLVSAENTARNAIYGVCYQRDVLGGRPRTAWQLDVFGHDPQFPALMSAAGLRTSSFARGPFHEWGPNWVHGARTELRWRNSIGGNPLMQFPTEFDWVAPSGASLLTCYMANHYSAGWWLDAATTLEEADHLDFVLHHQDPRRRLLCRCLHETVVYQGLPSFTTVCHRTHATTCACSNASLTACWPSRSERTAWNHPGTASAMNGTSRRASTWKTSCWPFDARNLNRSTSPGLMNPFRVAGKSSGAPTAALTSYGLGSRASGSAPIAARVRSSPLRGKSEPICTTSRSSSARAAGPPSPSPPDPSTTAPSTPSRSRPSPVPPPRRRQRRRTP